jgi:hypothetical protein
VIHSVPTSYEDEVFYSLSYCQSCGHHLDSHRGVNHQGTECQWDCGVGMCDCLKFVQKPKNWPARALGTEVSK